MVEQLFAQLEALSRAWQVKKIKGNYYDLTGITFEEGRLWQHPGSLRQEILSEYQRKIANLDRA
ncbi:MAG: hypothetical protein M1352_01260 [Patescibacteria group bacterium]|nr:hypothetical protein [Patescibacteria group bacterium]